MDRAKFDLLCEISDDILIGGSGIDLDKIALPSLHVVNAHPSREIFKLLTSNSIVDSLLKHVKFYTKNTRDYLRALVCHQKFYSNKDAISNVDVVFVSHLIQKDQFLNSEDFYYGDLPDLLGKVNLTSAIIYRNIAQVNPNVLLGNWADKSCVRIVPSKTLTLFSEFGLRLRLSRQLKFIKNYIKHKKFPDKSLSSYLAKAIVKLTDSYASIESLRFCDQMAEILSVLKPAVIVVTYEGHAWERAIFGVAKEINPRTICIGYQHTALNGTEHGMNRSLGQKFDPEVIWTTGSGAAKELSENMKIAPKGGIIAYGSYRSLGSLLSQEKCPESNDLQCLIAPDGTLEECVFMIPFAIKVAKMNPNITFIIRFHPLLPYSKLVKNYPYLKNLGSNLRVSTRELVNDIKSSQWVIYRGSSIVIPAVIHGLRPLYLKKENSLDIDPLYMMKEDWKKNVSSTFDVTNILNGKDGKSAHEIDLKKKSAQEYCMNYFENPRTNALLDSLKSIVKNAN